MKGTARGRSGFWVMISGSGSLGFCGRVTIQPTNSFSVSSRDALLNVGLISLTLWPAA